MSDLAVADTHALVWYATGRWKKLGRDARRTLERADAGRATVFVPAISLVELLEAEHRGALSFPGGAVAWTASLASATSFFVVDLSWEIVRRSHELYAIPERGDRLIAATALHLDLPLLTRDPGIGRAAGVKVVW